MKLENFEFSKALSLEQKRSMPMFFYYQEIVGFEQYLNGTIFPFQYSNRIFLVTAKHVISNKFKGQIQFADPHFDGKIIPISRILFGEAVEDFDNDFTDLVAFPIEMDKIDKDHLESLVWRSYNFRGIPSLIEGDSIRVIGFPMDPRSNLKGQEIDHESKQIKTVVYTLEGSYSGKTEFDHIGKAHLVDSLNLGGMSGSPIYKVTPDQKNHLIGLVHRGGDNTVYFIFIEVLLKLINDFLIKEKSAY
jgi:hypothetical protein